MQSRSLDLPGVVEVTPQRHRDERGYFSETYRDDWFREAVAPVRFVQENQSLSIGAGVVRGLHFQTAPFEQGKLVRCLAGAIFDVAVDLRRDSPTFGRWVAVTLSAEQGNQVWIPAGFAHGFCTLMAQTIVSYKVTAYYSAAHDAGLAWDDPDIGIAWPEGADRCLLSAKDRAQPSLRSLLGGIA